MQIIVDIFYNLDMKQIIRENYLDFLSKEAVFVEKEALIDELKNVIKFLDLSSFVNFADQKSKLKFMDEASLSKIYDNCFIDKLSKVKCLTLVYVQIGNYQEENYCQYIDNEDDLGTILKTIRNIKLLDRFNFDKTRILKILNYIFLNIRYEKCVKDEYDDEYIDDIERLNLYDLLNYSRFSKKKEFSSIPNLYLKIFSFKQRL